MAVTEGIGYSRGHRKEGMKLDFNDVKRAYFNAKAHREIYVELPSEDAIEGMCGKLLKSMYGTRDAAQNWEYEYMESMITACFVQGLQKERV